MPATKEIDVEAWKRNLRAAPLDDDDDACTRWFNNYFAFWFVCETKACKRTSRCAGDADACRDRFMPLVPQRMKFELRRDPLPARCARMLGARTRPASCPRNSPMPFMIVPAARPDLALTLVTDNGAAALALLPRHPGSRMQLFDNVPADCAAAEPDAAPHALLAKAGALAGVPVQPADADAQARILDFAVALYRAGTGRKAETAFLILGAVAGHMSLADAIAGVASTHWDMPLDAGAVGRFLALLKQPTPNKALSAFFKSAKGNKTLTEQIAQAGTDYAALAKVLAAHGVSIGAQDLQSYLAPWTYYTQVLQGLKARGVISAAKYDDAVGFTTGEYQITGLGPDIDPNLVNGWLSAISWTAKLPAFDDFALPMQALMVPFAVAVSDSLSGQNNLQLRDIPGMMADGVIAGFQATADGLQSFGDDMSSL